MARASNLKCALLWKESSEVRKLIAGPGSYMDSCIIVCKNILEKELTEGLDGEIRDVSALRNSSLKVPDPITICKNLMNM